MSDEEIPSAAAPVSFPPSAAMNYSNAAFDRISERVERSRDDPHQAMMLAQFGLPIKSGTQMLAASSALAGLTKPSVTGHNYHQQQEYLPDEDPDCDFQIPLRFTKSGRKRATPFPMKLMKVLSTRRLNDIISWTPDGTAFAILRPKAFANDVLPHYFKEAKYSSFTRKLHRWGFQRHLRGSDSGSFYHKNFQRGRLDLLDLMTCYKPREASARAAGKLPKSPKSPSSSSTPRKERSSSMGQQQQPTASMIAEAQAMRARQQQAEQMGVQTQMGEISEEQLNAAIEFEVSRRLQQRVDAASLSRLAMMQQGSPPPPQPNMPSFEGGGMSMPPPGFAASSPGRLAGPPRGGLGQFDSDLNARLQQATALHFARGYDDARFPPRNFDEQQQQHFDPNLDSMGRGA